jgi:hypothetical protein
MPTSRKVAAPLKGFSTPPLVTRGLRRQQQRRRRKRETVPPDALIVGVDLARERQAVSFVAGGVLEAGCGVRSGGPLLVACGGGVRTEDTSYVLVQPLRIRRLAAAECTRLRNF